MADSNIVNALPLGHVLCPIDSSAMSLNALRWANAIARARAAELRAFHVVVPADATSRDTLGFSEHAGYMAMLREALAAVDSTNDRVGAAVRLGDPGQQIVQFARALPADLIVMGAAGSERPQRPIGSVTATVVSRADCPVLIIPTGARPNPEAPGLFTRIVCAVDLAPSSIGVIRQALSLTRETRARVTFVCVMIEPEPSSSQIHDRLLTCIPREARGWGQIEVVVKAGVPAREIMRVTQICDADVLVIGAPRHWTSTTEEVLAGSVCPVFVAHDIRPLPFPKEDGIIPQTTSAAPSAS